MSVSSKNGVLFCATKHGFIYVYELVTGSLIARSRISDSVVFVGAKNTKTEGIVTISKSGQVTNIDVEESKIVPYLL